MGVGPWTGCSTCALHQREGFKPGPIPYRKKLLQSRAKPCPSPHLLQHAASEGFKDFSSSEAVRRLHHAAFCGSVASVQALLETLSSEDWCRACDAVGTSVLHAAVTGGHLHIANALLREGAFFDAQNLKGQTPLHLACGNGALALTRLLLSARADPRLGDLAENQVPAMVATLRRASWWSSGPEPLSMDISAPGSTNPASELAVSKSWQRPTGYLEARLVTAEVCLQAMEEWDPDFPAAASLLNSRGETALHIAASAGDLELCRLLLSFQASVNDAESGSGLTPLMCAVRVGASEVVRQLIIAKADLHLLDAASRSALHHAAACGDTAVRDAAELLRWRAEANASDSEGATPLMLAASLGAPEMIRFLLKQGASPQVCRAMLPNISHNASLEILRGIL